MRLTYVGQEEESDDRGQIVMPLTHEIDDELEAYPDEFDFTPLHIAQLFASTFPFSMDFDMRFRSEFGGTIWIDFSFAAKHCGKLEFLLDSKRQVVYLEEVELHPPFQGMGLFKVLMGRFLTFVKATGITKSNLTRVTWAATRSHAWVSFQPRSPGSSCERHSD